MKKLLFTLLLAAFVLPYAAAQGKLEIGQKAPEWTFTNSDKSAFHYELMARQGTADQLC